MRAELVARAVSCEAVIRWHALITHSVASLRRRLLVMAFELACSSWEQPCAEIRFNYAQRFDPG